MTAALTGGTGFLGRALLRLLSGEAQDVRALVRRESDRDLIESFGATPVMGDLTGRGDLGSLLRPGDVVFHAAARVDTRGRWEDFRRISVDGTRRLVDLAVRAGVSRFVFVSSAAVYSPRAAHRRPASCETTPANPPRYNYYARAKLEAEELIRSECERAGCPWTILRFGFIYGPGNRAMVEHMTRFHEKNRLMIVGDGNNRLTVLHVEDAARAVVLAGRHPAAADRVYDVTSDEIVTQRDYVNASARVLGLPSPTREVPRWLAFGAAFLADQIARFTRQDPAISRAMVNLMSTDQVLDAARFRREIGWSPEIAFADGMEQTRQWYLAHTGRETSEEMATCGRQPGDSA